MVPEFGLGLDTEYVNNGSMGIWEVPIADHIDQMKVKRTHSAGTRAESA